ncbi:double C2-like domain-containing protein [Babesia caballi]|uniref:Double C2-like domain-containing protein n=1 Tax=Babesia caballi TaxID=5871 RepID=A0AAV4LNZ5_BABCB|nr:double C2-like domain-containing protein [Babesia caballi]
MHGLKVPGLNFDIFTKVGAKEDVAERAGADALPSAESDKAAFEAGKAAKGDPGQSSAETAGGTEAPPDVNEALAEHELLWSTQYTYDEFIDSLSVAHEGRGESPNEKRHWSYPRRWLVKLHNLKIVNCVADSLTCFAEFDFGGSRSECRVQMGGSVCILNRGETKNYIRTTVVQNVTRDVQRSFNCAHEFEYRGSYLDLEHEKLKIKLWKYRRYTVNSLESIYEGQLLQFAKGDIHVEIPMYKGLNKQRHLRCRISFDLYFQELYDFELSFLRWRLSDVPSFVDLLYKSKESFEKLKLDSGGSGEKGKRRPKQPSTMSFSIFDKMTYYFIRRRIDRDYAKEATLRRETTKVLGDEHRTSVDSLDPYKVLLRSQDDIVFKINSISHIKNSLPSLKLQVHIKTDSAFRHDTSLQLSSLISRNTRDAYWENMGELVFRGTMLDLERAELEVDIIDITAPKAANRVGRVVLPLAGVVDYPFLKSQVSKPKWLSLKASMEGWGPQLDRLNFGSLSGTIQIQRQPRYRQLTNPSGLTLYSYPMMLIVTVGGVDQLVLDDDNAIVDSYVEVTYNRLTYRTFICRNNRAPTWNEDILVPFLTNDGEKISCSVVMQSPPVRFTVWGTSETDGKVMYLGGAVLHPHEIFYTTKGALKSCVKKTYAENGQYGNMYESRVFETRVFSGPLKLSFLNNDDRQSSLTVSAWIYPDMPEEVMPDQFDARLVRSEKVRLPSFQLTAFYSRLLQDWQRVVDMKLRPIFKDVGLVNVECLTQYQQRVFLPSLITPMHPPMGIYTPNAIFHMVRCVPFVRKTYNSRFTPDFLMKLKGGNAFDHCVLQCSYLRGLIPPVDAFICVGTTHDGRPHAWVATFMPSVNKSVKMWESTTGDIQVLKHRLSSEEDRSEPVSARRLKLKTSSKFPYKTLLYVFNESNVWLNVQGFTDPQVLLYDLDDSDLWYPFAPHHCPADATYVPKISYAKVNEYDIQRVSHELQQNIERHLTIHRYAQNLQTRWNRDEALGAFLVTGMKLLHQINMCPDEDVQLAKCELQEWKILLNKNIPQSHQVIVVPLHFNTVDAEFIAENIKTNVPTLDSRERFITFAMASRVISLPGNLFSVYVILLVAQKIHERVRIRLVMEHERLAQRKRKKKSVSAAEDDSNDVENREDNLNESLKAALESNLEMSGESIEPKKLYSGLVDKLDSILDNQDDQLNRLLSRSITRSSNAGRQKTTSLATPGSTEGSTANESDLSHLVSSGSDVFSKLKSDVDESTSQISASSMSINFGNLSSSQGTTPRGGGKAADGGVASTRGGHDVGSAESQAGGLMYSPSYEYDKEAEGGVPIGETKTLRVATMTYRDSVLNPNLMSSASCSYASSLNSVGSRIIIKDGSFEESDGGTAPEQPPTPISQALLSMTQEAGQGEEGSATPASGVMTSRETLSLGMSPLASCTSSSSGLFNCVGAICSPLRTTSSSSQETLVSGREDSARRALAESSADGINSALISDASHDLSGGSPSHRDAGTSSVSLDASGEETDAHLEAINPNLVSRAYTGDLGLESDAEVARLTTQSDTLFTEDDDDDWSDSIPSSSEEEGAGDGRIPPSESGSDGASLLSSRLVSQSDGGSSPSINRAVVSRDGSSAVSSEPASPLLKVDTADSDVSVETNLLSTSSAPLHSGSVSSVPSIQSAETQGGTESSSELESASSKAGTREQAKSTGQLRYNAVKNIVAETAKAPPETAHRIRRRRTVHGSDADPLISSTEQDESSTVGSEQSSSTAKVSFAKLASMYSTDSSVVHVPTQDPGTPSSRLARSLYDKANVKSDEKEPPVEPHRTVCDFKDDKAIVVCDEGHGIRALPQTPESRVAPAEFRNVCPLCGNELDDSQYTYIAQTYFYLLQRNFKKWAAKRDQGQPGYGTRSSSVRRSASLRQPLPGTGDNLRSSTDAGSGNSYHRGVSLPKDEYDASDDYFGIGVDVVESDVDVPKHIPPELLVTGYYDRFFEERFKLGSGSFGHVYYCIHIIDGLALGEYAVKKLPVGDDREWLRKMIREVKVRERLRHRNIVDYNHSWLEMHRLNEFCPYVPWLFVLMAYCNGGDLENFVKRFHGQLDDEEIFVLLLDIVNGLCHLHRHGIIYRDLKPSNVLLHFSQKEGVSALLSDFGTCEVLAELGDREVRRQGFTGTVEFTAPELLETDQFGEFSIYYDTKSDMWSLGIILFYLCYGTLPYFDASPKVCRDKILQHSYLELPRTPARCTELQMLIVALTQRIPARRPDCESILGDRCMLGIIRDEEFINSGRAKIAMKIATFSGDSTPRDDKTEAIIRV